jgi:HAD superfamily phosphoserine phosphatase-like hydrolase
MSRSGVDPASLAVFLDFDGTITRADVGVHLMERLAPPEWRAIEAEYVGGGIGSRICLLDEWELLPRDEARLRSVAAEVPVDPGFEPLVRGLVDAGAEVAVVSDGFGFYVEPVCAPLGIPVFTNRVDWSEHRLEFPHEDRCCACSSCGTCKQAPIKDAKRRGRETVLVGDGTSDRKAAALADLVFATGALAAWCDAFGLPHRRFESLADVHAELLG